MKTDPLDKLFVKETPVNHFDIHMIKTIISKSMLYSHMKALQHIKMQICLVQLLEKFHGCRLFQWTLKHCMGCNIIGRGVLIMAFCLNRRW